MTIEQLIVRTELAYARARVAWLAEYEVVAEQAEVDMLTSRIRALSNLVTP